MTFRASGKIVVYRNGSLPSAVVRRARRQLLKSRQMLDYLSLVYSAPPRVLALVSLFATEPLGNYFSYISRQFKEHLHYPRRDDLRKIARDVVGDVSSRDDFFSKRTLHVAFVVES